MGLFRSRVDPRDNLIATLRSEISDMKDERKLERAQFESDRRELLDRIIALTNPLVLREMRRTSPGEPAVPASIPQSRRLHYPGSDARVLPPPPIRPVTPPSENSKDSTPGEAAG